MLRESLIRVPREKLHFLDFCLLMFCLLFSWRLTRNISFSIFIHSTRVMMIRIAHLYRDWALRSPYIANCSAGIIIASIGDAACQRYFPHPQIKNEISDKILENKEAAKNSKLPSWWDPMRTVNINIIRCGVITPFVLAWYPTLLKLCPGQSVLRVLGRIAIDQSIGAPSCVFLVFVMNTILQFESFDQFVSRLKNQFFTTWFRGFQYWPFVHMINFGFVPLVYQPLFATLCSVYWNAVLSYYVNYPQQLEPYQSSE